MEFEDPNQAGIALGDKATENATIAVRPCPKCAAPNKLGELIKNSYRCTSCGFELAYLDRSATGAIRSVLGWIHGEGAVIEGRYRITQLLGRGGYGSTYLVEDLALSNKRRALKEIPNELFNEAEATLLARLDHPAIPDIIERLSTDRMTYLVLSFGGTRTLGSERVRLGGRVPIAKLTSWMHQLCRALTYLHGQNPPIVHRDLKPDNILLDEQDNVMLIDFGIAKLADPTERTRTISRAVSFGFSPPEQLMCAGTDQRSDIYSLGATVYYLATGVYPPDFREHTDGKKPEPMGRLASGIPGVLDKAISKALSINPGQRQQSIHELLAVFEDLDRTIPRTTLPLGQQPPPRRYFAVAGGLALTATALAAALWHYAGSLPFFDDPVPSPATETPVVRTAPSQPTETAPEPDRLEGKSLAATEAINSPPIAAPRPEGGGVPALSEAVLQAIGEPKVISSRGDLALSTEKLRYHVGEYLNLWFTAARPSHIYIVYVTSNHDAAQIYPYKNQPDKLHEINQIYAVPPQTGSKPKLRIDKPLGRDKIVVLASETVLLDAAQRVKAGDLLSGNDTGLSVAQLSIDVLP